MEHPRLSEFGECLTSKQTVTEGAWAPTRAELQEQLIAGRKTIGNLRLYHENNKYRPRNEPTERLHPDRIAGGDCDHRYSGVAAPARPGQSQGEGQGHQVFEQHETDHSGLHDLRKR